MFVEVDSVWRVFAEEGGHSAVMAKTLQGATGRPPEVLPEGGRMTLLITGCGLFVGPSPGEYFVRRINKAQKEESRSHLNRDTSRAAKTSTSTQTGVLASFALK